MKETPIADFTRVEYRGNELRCPVCHQWRKSLLCIAGGDMICQMCHRERPAYVVAGAEPAAG